jgi:acetyl esterase/lipase
MLAAGFFFFIALLGFLTALNTLRRAAPDVPPLRRPLWIPMLLTAELIPLRVISRSVIGGLLIWAGALDYRAGRIALGLTLATWIIYGLLIRRSLQTGPAMRAALVEAGISAKDFVEIDWPSVFLAWPWRVPGDIERLEDIEYAPGLHLDLYRARDNTSDRAPILLQVHGGGWRGGNRRQQARPLMDRLAARGWICASISYPLSPAATFPEHLIAVKQAIAWLKREAPNLGGDPGSIVITGGSAGGHLAALAALTPDDITYQPGFETEDTTVAGAITLYGIYDFLNRNRTRDNWPLIPNLVMKARPDEAVAAYQAASPLDQVTPAAPPWLVIHGGQDAVVPPHESRQFSGKLAEVSDAPAVYVELPGATHTFDIVHSIRSHITISGIARFAEHVVSHDAEAAR